MGRYDLIVKGRMAGSEWRGVWTFETKPLADFLVAVQEAGSLLNTLYGALPLSRLSAQWEAYGLDYRPVDQPGFGSIPLNWTTVTGANGGQLLDVRTGLLGLLRSPTQKPNRGRKYFNGFTEDSNGPDGRPDAVARDGVVAAMSNLVGFNAGGANPLGAFVIASRNPDGTVFATNRIESVATSVRWARLTSRGRD